MDNVTFHETGLAGMRISDPQVRSEREAFSDINAARLRETKRGNPGQKVKIKEAYDFLQDVVRGKRQTWQLDKAMTTSDFQLLFGDILQREVLGNYAAYQVS